MSNPIHPHSYTHPSIKMKFPIPILTLFLAGALANPTPVEKRATTMCGGWGTVPTAGFTVYHNNWGSSAATSGSQCTTFNSVSSAKSFSWSTAWSWAGGNVNVKSYSNVALENVNKKLSAISSIPSTWTWR
jgi:xyloglucan-specific endo-beta-1,4-glucanase